jgi:uncharacterized RDD family membrane protein YckC
MTMAVSVPNACPRCNTPNIKQGLFCNACRVYLRDDTLTVERVTYNRRFWGSYLLEGVLFVVTLVIGWFIWMIFTSKTGQSPAKRLLNIYVLNVETGRGIGQGDAWIREVVIKLLAFGVLSSITSGLSSIADGVWVLVDKDRQALHDKLLKQVVVYAPAGLPAAIAQMENAPMLYQSAGVLPQTGPAVAPATMADTAEQIRELTRLRDEGLITPEEYEEKRAALAARL